MNINRHIANKANYGEHRSTSQIKYLVYHYTANDGDTDEANANYFKNNIVEASAHYFVDDNSITQSVPDDYVAWSVGGSKYANTNGGKFHGICTNYNSISIELCDNVRNGVYDFTPNTLNNAVELGRMLMKKYNIPLDRVIRHYDVTGKICPKPFVDNERAWIEFKKRLENKVMINGVNTVRRLCPGSAHLYCDAPVRDKNGEVIINAKKGAHITILDHGTAGVKVRHNNTVGFMDCKYVMPDIKKGDKLTLVEDVTVTIKKGTVLTSCDSGYLGNIVNGDFIVSSKSFEKVE